MKKKHERESAEYKRAVLVLCELEHALDRTPLIDFHASGGIYRWCDEHDFITPGQYKALKTVARNIAGIAFPHDEPVDKPAEITNGRIAAAVLKGTRAGRLNWKRESRFRGAVYKARFHDIEFLFNTPSRSLYMNDFAVSVADNQSELHDAIMIADGDLQSALEELER